MSFARADICDALRRLEDHYANNSLINQISKVADTIDKADPKPNVVLVKNSKILRVLNNLTQQIRRDSK